MADSSIRKLVILANLPRYPRKIDTKALQTRCCDQGLKVSLRTIQRDLNELSRHFPLHADEAIPQGWSLPADAAIAIPAFDLTTAVSFALAEEHLSPLLPKSMQQQLAPYFNTAKQFLKGESKNTISGWPEKIQVHSKGLPLLLTDIAEEVIDTVYGGVLHQRCIKLRYTSISKHEGSEYIVHPHGIVVRDERSYLIARKQGHDNLIQLSLNRIDRAEELEQEAELMQGFCLNEYIKQGNMGVIHDDNEIQISLWITDVLAKLLRETPLSEDQLIIPKGEDCEVTATVQNTEELRYWILSMCNHITVQSPRTLRDEIVKTLEDSLSYY